MGHAIIAPKQEGYAGGETMIEPLSVASALEENVVRFEGHPAGGENEDLKAGDEDLKVEVKEVKPEGGEEPKEPKEEKKVEPKSFKYENQEKAEAAYKEAESLIGKKGEEAKRERERAEDLQKQLNELLVTKATLKETPKPTSAARMKELLEQVNALDPEDSEYHAKVAEIWGRREDEIQSTVESKVQEALDAYEKRANEERAKAEREVLTQKTILSTAEKAGKEAGLDMKKDSTDSELFWTYADKAPEGTIDEQITWTINKIKNVKAAYTTPLKSSEEVKAIQNQNSVLERQGQGKTPERVIPEKPIGLADVFKQLQRRI